MGAVSGAMAAAARRGRRRAGHPGDGHGAGRRGRTASPCTGPTTTARTRPSTPAHVVCGAAPTVLAELTGADAGPRPSGSQLKVNMVLARLPRLRSGADPATALRRHLPRRRGRGPARRRVRAGRRRAAARRHPVRGVLPLADRPVGPRAGRAGRPGCTRSPCSGCTPRPSCSAAIPVGTRQEAVRRVVAQLDAHLEEPLLDCLARDAAGRAVPAGGLTAGRRGVAGHARRPHLPRRPVLAGRRRRRRGRHLGRRDRRTRGSWRRPPAAPCAAARSAGSAATPPPATCSTPAEHRRVRAVGVRDSHSPDQAARAGRRGAARPGCSPPG